MKNFIHRHYIAIISIICLYLIIYHLNAITKCMVFGLYTLIAVIESCKSKKFLDIMIYAILLLVLIIGFFVYPPS
ncbi:MAG: hypothetical protein ACE3JK_02775 [Sporolactobacillus sp.]